MKFKGFALALLLTLGAMVGSVSVLADPPPVPQLTCIKAQSDVALHLRVTNNGPGSIAKGKKVNYSYKTAAGSANVSGVYTLENALAAGQSRSFFVFPQAGHDTPIYQCNASVQVYAPVKPKNP